MFRQINYYLTNFYKFVTTVHFEFLQNNYKYVTGQFLKRGSHWRIVRNLNLMCWTSQSSKRYKAKKNLTKYFQINMKYDENSNKDLARITHNVRNNTGRCSTEKCENKKKRGERRKVRRGEVVLITIPSTKQNNAAAGSVFLL